MPKPAVLILDDRRKRGMNPLARCNVGGLMDRGSHERVSKPNLHCIEIDQLGGGGGRKGVDSDILGQQHFAGAQDFVERRSVVFSGNVQQHLSGARKTGQAAGEGAFKSLRQGKPWSFPVVLSSQAVRQLYQRQWIAGGFLEKAVAQLPGEVRGPDVEQAGRIDIAERRNDMPQCVGITKWKGKTLS